VRLVAIGSNIYSLADVTIQIYRSGNATGWKSAARQAVKRSGVTYKPDVERIASDVCRHLQIRSTSVRNSRKKREQLGLEEQERSQEPRQLNFPF